MMGGISPVEVMLDNMRVAHRKAKKLEAKLRSETDEADAAETLTQALKFREMAQSAAREAAPYMHPRLAAIEARLTPQNEPQPESFLKDHMAEIAERYLRPPQGRSKPNGESKEPA